MDKFSSPSNFLWRVSSAVLRRSGILLTRLGNDAYYRSRPKLDANDVAVIRANETFRNRHRDQRCFVIGNGPSLKKQDLNFLSNELTFAVNGFWKHPNIKQWQPTYYLLSDPIYFDGSPHAARFFQDLRRYIHSSHFFVPLSSRSVVKEQGLLSLEQTSYFAFNDRTLGDASENEFDLTKPIPFAQTVPQLSILVALFMGFSRIYLIGLDNDYLARLEGGGYNFFDGLTLNHPQAIVEPVPYDNEMRSMLKVWQGYHTLKAQADKVGAQIFNATHGGFLDVFPRVSYESLFECDAHAVS